MTARLAAPAPPAERPEPSPALHLVEADTGIAARLRASFAARGLPCDAHGGPDALLESLAADSRPPRLVLLGGEDVAAPLSALRRLRTVSRLPCILLVAGLDEGAGILAREAGADDAVDRAAAFPALLARVRAVLRRAEWGPGAAAAARLPAAAAVGPAAPAAAAAAGLDGWRLLPERRQLLRPDGRECPLTTAEFDLVRVLVERPGRAVSRDAIARSVFGRPFRPEDRTVDNLVLRLRRKLDAAGPRAIRTVRGAGYMFAGFGRGGGDRAAGREGGRAA